MVVVMLKKQSKQLRLHSHSSPGAVDSLPTSPPRSSYEMQKEELKKANEEQSCTWREENNSPDSPQDHHREETGM